MNRAIPTPVSSAFDAIDADERASLLKTRDLIFQVTDEDARIGEIEETLRWGEPAYMTTQKKTGSTIRLGVEKASGSPALFFNCKTTLVEEFRDQFGGALKYVKNRAVLIDEDQADALKICIAAALTYHLREN